MLVARTHREKLYLKKNARKLLSFDLLLYWIIHENFIGY